MVALALLLALVNTPKQANTSSVKARFAAITKPTQSYLQADRIGLSSSAAEPVKAKQQSSVSDLEIHTRFVPGPEYVMLPAGKQLKLDRHTLPRYFDGHLSPMRHYDDFRLQGQVTFRDVSPDACNVGLELSLSTFSYVWALAVIDDGQEIQFHSNGVLERMYLDGLRTELASGVLLGDRPPSHP